MPKTVQNTRNYIQSTRTYSILIVIVLLIGGYYSFHQYQKFTAANAALVQEQETLTNLQANVSGLSTQYADLKKSSDEKFKTILASIQKIYPDKENYTALARLFDEFFKPGSTTNPVFNGDLTFGVARTELNKDYSVLPITVSMSGKKSNFLTFLKSIESSGELEDGTRLMDIRSISINFNSTSSDQNSTSDNLKDPSWNVSVGLNAYFQKATTK